MRLIDADKITFFDCLAKKGNSVCCHAKGIVSKDGIDAQPTVEAIPIEWLDTYCTDSDIGLRDNDPIAIRKLVEDWREEEARLFEKRICEEWGVPYGENENI